MVLSKALVSSEMGAQSPTSWHFLDDYAAWLGQKEEQIADILALSPQMIEGQPVLKVVVAEAKYVIEPALSEAQKKSRKQLRDTVDRIENALFGNPERLDRDLWLARISDMLLEGIGINSVSSLALEDWGWMIRRGEVAIDLSGYSHVFISGPSGSTKGSEQIPIAKVERRYQEVFSREQVRSLVLAFHAKQSVSPIREQLGADRPWEKSDPRAPAGCAVFVKAVKTSDEPAEKKPEATSPPAEVVEEPRERQEFPDIEAPESESTTVSDGAQRRIEVQADDSNLSDGVREWVARNSAHIRDNAQAQTWLDETVKTLCRALISYDLQAKVLGQQLTPNAAIIQLMGSDRLKIRDIEQRQDQLLTTHGLRLISIGGLPGQVVVSIARPEREPVSLAEVWGRRKINAQSGMNLSLVVGLKEIDGAILYLNMGAGFEGLQQHHPHTLIAGTTGSGKSVLLRNLLLDICATNPPDLSRIYLIDPKAGVDYFLIEELPHLNDGIIIDQDHAIEALRNLVEVMDQRYLTFRANRVRDLLSYNAKVEPKDRLPVLWVVHDEFTEWMLVDSYREEVSAIVQRLGVKARAAGIHLIFAAQRPDATVLPVQLRDNLGNRLILRVESVGTSEICLGQKGAERLLGKGHLAARLSGESDLIYAQVPFITDGDAEALVQSIRRSFPKNNLN